MSVKAMEDCLGSYAKLLSCLFLVQLEHKPVLQDVLAKRLRSKCHPCLFNTLSAIRRPGKSATQPCLCGYLGHHNGRCHCTPAQVLRYRGKISGPLLDRIDIHIEVPAVAPEDLARTSSGESSGVVRERVEKARADMITRQGKDNARLATREIDRYCAPDTKGAALLTQAINRLGLSARAYHRILKVARTIADLAHAQCVSDAHVAEAIQYRRFDRA